MIAVPWLWLIVVGQTIGAALFLAIDPRVMSVGRLRWTLAVVLAAIAIAGIAWLDSGIAVLRIDAVGTRAFVAFALAGGHGFAAWQLWRAVRHPPTDAGLSARSPLIVAVGVLMLLIAPVTLQWPLDLQLPTPRLISVTVGLAMTGMAIAASLAVSSSDANARALGCRWLPWVAGVLAVYSLIGGVELALLQPAVSTGTVIAIAIRAMAILLLVGVAVGVRKLSGRWFVACGVLLAISGLATARVVLSTGVDL